MGWTNLEDAELRKLVGTGQFLYTEIAEKLGRNAQTTRWRARKLGLDNSEAMRTMGRWNNKHAHLRLEVMTYFLNHSTAECMKKFGLTKSELKSLMSISYSLPEFTHLRKDQRQHREWTTEEYIFLLRHAGLKPRDWIAKKLKRGGPIGIKERLQKIGVSSRTLNGLTVSQYRVAFGKEPSWYLETKAGPGNGSNAAMVGYYKIVPWVQLEKELRNRRICSDPTFETVIGTMAVFQKWVHGRSYIQSLKLAAGRGHGFRVRR